MSLPYITHLKTNLPAPLLKYHIHTPADCRIPFFGHASVLEMDVSVLFLINFQTFAARVFVPHNFLDARETVEESFILFAVESGKKQV